MQLTSVLPAFKRYALYEKGMQPKTIREISSIVTLLAKQTLTPTVKGVQTLHIREFLYQRKQERMWSNKTFRNYRQYLKSFFDYCVRENFIATNPVLKIEKPKLPKRLPRCLSKQQLETLLIHLDSFSWSNTLEEKRNQAIFRTFLFTGIRLSELLNLKTSSVNLEQATLLIYQGKGLKDRIIPIHPSLMPYLKSYHHLKRNKPTRYFFSSIRSNKPLTKNNLYRVFKVLRKQVHFSFTPHQLRHTFGKLSIEANLNPFMLQKLMGHSSIDTTQIYVSVSDEKLKETFGKTPLL